MRLWPLKAAAMTAQSRTIASGNVSGVSRGQVATYRNPGSASMRVGRDLPPVDEQDSLLFALERFVSAFCSN